MSDISRNWQARKPIYSVPVYVITLAEKQADPERYMPPHAAGTVKLFRDRGHNVKVRANREGSLRYMLDGERERTALEFANRYSRLYEK